MKEFFFICGLSLLPLGVSANSILISGADVYSSAGVLARTSVYIEDGVIRALGDSVPDSADMQIDAAGKSITAGLFNASTHLGAVEVGMIDETVDFFSENPAVTASFKIADAFNPQSTLIPFNRVHGLSHALLVPEAGSHLFAGQVALVQLGNRPVVINDSVAVAVDYTESGFELAHSSRATAMAMLRQALTDALDFAANKAAALAGDRRDYSLSLADLAALEPVINGYKPLLVRTHRASDIGQILRLAAEYKLQLILSGVSEGWMVAEQIAAANVPVIIDPIANLPASFESLGARLDNAKLLSDAGVKLVFTGMSWLRTHNAYLVRQSAGNAVANGLDKGVAIAAMTYNPANLFASNVSGDIVLGAVADLVLWSGDPLELTSEPDLVMIGGEVISLESRSLQLRDRYYKRLQKSSP
ncbi:MAG: imidazolonepropionase [Porticoccaceae bacterium]|nr:imidazolonepropionase [Porticoccaceae bacterium]